MLENVFIYIKLNKYPKIYICIIGYYYYIMKKCLLVIDVQYDYCEGGPMGYNNSIEIIPIINKVRDNYELIIFCGTIYPNNHSIFKKFGGTCPRHCVIDSKGSELHNDLIIKDDDIKIYRGMLQKYDSSSCFYEAENISKQTKLRQYLILNKIDEIHVCGNKFEDSIFSTVIDIIMMRLKCKIIMNAITYQDKYKMELCNTFLKSLGIIGIDA